MDILILLNFTVVCAVSDLRTHKIPNRLILCGLIWAFLCCLFRDGAPGVLLDGVLGFLLPILLLGPLCALRMIGGGDVKLLAVIGLQLGAGNSFRVLYTSFLFGALWSVCLVIRRKNLFSRLHILYRYIGHVMAGEKLLPYHPGRSDPSGEFCFALPVLAALCTLIMGNCIHGPL